MRLDISRTTGNGWALRLRFERDASTARACAAWSSRRPTFAVDSYEVHQPGAGDAELLSPYMDDGELDLEALGARRARARAARPRSSAARTARACARSAARTSTRTRITPTRRSRTRAGRKLSELKFD